MKKRSSVLIAVWAVPLVLGAAVLTQHDVQTPAPAPTVQLAQVATPAAVTTRSDKKPTGALVQNVDQRETAKTVYGVLSDSNYAYRPRALDDALAADIAKRYLESLDGAKMFLTAADVASFNAQQSQLDDDIKAGDFKRPFAVFDTYRKRVKERSRFARALLNKDIFDFSGHDRVEFDREKAPWAASNAELDTLWTNSVRNDWLRLKLAGKQPADIRKTLDKRYANIEKAVSEYSSEDIFQIAMNAYANSIDPHTDYLNPRTAERFNQQMSLQLQGIGAVLTKPDDVVVVRELVPGGPAALSKLVQPGMRIIAVGQGEKGPMEDVVGWRIDDVVEKIKGNKGTKVRLDLVPPGVPIESKPNHVLLTRDIVKLTEDAAKSEIIEVPSQAGQPAKRIGVIKLPSFYEDFEGRRRGGEFASSSRDVARLLQEFQTQNIDGVVLDFRNNGGGSLGEAVRITGLFIDQGPVVQVRESGGRVTINQDRTPGVLWRGPLAIVINRATASASEIVAGAIKDYGRGVIIGETTYGKGTVQNLMDLDRWPGRGATNYGQLKLTIAQFFLPAGSSTQNKGVTPDVHYPVTVDAADFGESTNENALPWSKIDSSDFERVGNLATLNATLEAQHTARVRNDPEFKWLLEDLAEYKERRDRKYISLNEVERKAERDAAEAKIKTRQEARKKLGLKLDPLADDPNDDGLSTNERDVAKQLEREKLAEERPDPLLRESANILVDAINDFGRNPALLRQTFPQAQSPVLWVK